MANRFLHDHRKFAPVAPVGVLLRLQQESLLPRYNLILAHNIVQRAKSFEVLVKQQELGGVWFIDNSVIELGYPVEPDVMYEAWKVIHYAGGIKPAKEVVCILPDVLLNSAETIQTAREAVKDLRKLGLSNFMYVPQGTNWDEIIRSAEAMQTVEEIRWIGVAKNFVNILGTRRDITIALQSIFPKAKFHMLGWSRYTFDDIRCTLLPGVEGIDSSMPLRCSEPISMLSQFSKRGNWWQEDMECTDLMMHNVRQVNKWLGS